MMVRQLNYHYVTGLFLVNHCASPSTCDIIWLLVSFCAAYFVVKRKEARRGECLYNKESKSLN